jgi:hypothetical protein
MKRSAILVLVSGALVACGGPGEEPGAGAAPAESGVTLTVEAPAPLEVPEPKEVSSDTDWEAKAHNKEIEVIQVMNIINPVAAYIVEGFEQYGDRFSPTLSEEWEDTQAQLTKATTLYDACKERKAAGDYDKQLFLDLEEVWQLLVKTGVAGVRTKSMVDDELKRMTG